MGASDVFGAATVVVAVGFSVPQAAKLWRGDGDGAGVSAGAMVNSAVSFLAWTLYAGWIGDFWLFASSAIGLPGATAAAALAWRRPAARPGAHLPMVWIATLLLAVIGQARGLGPLVPVTVGTSVAWLVLPALVRAWRSHDVSGIAAVSWCVLAGEGAIFLGYGRLQGLLAPTLYGVVCVLGAGGVLARLMIAHTRPRSLQEVS
jgi:uncharacterized protein with PQ loop repeat